MTLSLLKNVCASKYKPPCQRSHRRQQQLVIWKKVSCSLQATVAPSWGGSQASQSLASFKLWIIQVVWLFLWTNNMKLKSCANKWAHSFYLNLAFKFFRSQFCVPVRPHWASVFLAVRRNSFSVGRGMFPHRREQFPPASIRRRNS